MARGHQTSNSPASEPNGATTQAAAKRRAAKRAGDDPQTPHSHRRIPFPSESLGEGEVSGMTRDVLGKGMSSINLHTMYSTSNCPCNAINQAVEKLEEAPRKRLAFDAIGQPRGVPNDFKARNEVASGFESILPWITVNKNTEWINYLYYNQQRFINYTDEALTALGQQLSATSAMTWQNRQVLDWLLAERGGVCTLIGQVCCTFIPNNTAPTGRFAQAMTDLKALRQEVKDNAGHKTEWFEMMRQSLGDWGFSWVRIGIAVLLTLLAIVLILCCCIPIFRSRVKTHYAFPMVAEKGELDDSQPLFLLSSIRLVFFNV